MEFTKLQATGNDFVFVDARTMKGDWALLAKNICDRHFGIGADGLILVLSSDKADFQMRIFNPDGSEAQICGNGLRCFAKYVVDNRLTLNSDITISTLAGIKKIQSSVVGGKVKEARVNMGQPNFATKDIPVKLIKSQDNFGSSFTEPVLDHSIMIEHQKLSLSFVSMGNPHSITFITAPVSSFPLLEIGPLIEHDSIFPERTNFEVAKIINHHKIEVRVWERGAGETLACGSGACAVAVIAHLKGFTGEDVDIMLPGGKLSISWDGAGDVYMSGPVEMVFTGQYNIPGLPK
jgi:diaminopimelate epimerase